MRKNCIKAGILSLALFLLSACAAPENGGITEWEPDLGLPEGQSFSASAETMPEETVSESGGESSRVEPNSDQTVGGQEKLPERESRIGDELVSSEEGEVSEPEISLTAYQKVVEESNTGMVFSLINLDGDEIPELVAGDRGNDRYFIYTIKDGTVFCLVDSMTTAELTYYEGSGIIAAFARWNGGGDEGGYGRQYYQTSSGKTLTDEDIPVLSYSYNAVYDEEGVYTGKGAADYFSMGQETDESAYNEILEMLGITEDEGRLCLENAVAAEEMPDILR
ncbi:MAG: hypothetical protein K2J60_04495 [Acetatifactor sp.]|nr:hypothetical protein [Acetatifactor sp.]